MAISDDVWQMAQTIWENTPNITWRELADKLSTLFDTETPSYSVLNRRAKKYRWQKVTIRKGNKYNKQEENETNNETNSSQHIENNKEEKNATSIISATKNTQQKIFAELDSLVLTAQEKKEIIIKHRKRWQALGELHDNTIDTINTLHSLDVDKDGDTIQRVIVVGESLSRTLQQLSNSQKVISEHEFAVCGITVDDFRESEHDKRQASLETLAGINELATVKRAELESAMLERLSRFEQLAESGNFDELLEDDENIAIEEGDL